MPTIAVTGVTGELGGRVARRLAKIGQPQRLIVRDPGRAPQLDKAEITQASFENIPAFKQALTGAQTLFLVPGNVEGRLNGHFAVIDAAVEVGVERIVYLSFLACAPQPTFTHSREHWQTEDYIRSRGLRYTFLRPNFYLDAVPGWFSPEGIIQGPAGTGTISWVSRDDIADVAATVLTTEGHDGCAYAITGPEALTLDQTAARLAEATGKPAAYKEETIEEARASRAKYNASEWDLTAWISTYEAIATGELSVVSHTVQVLAGHAPQSLADYLRQNPDSYKHIVSGGQ
jgi:NAD(P)H dehydrogenase (quinone)